MRKMLSKFFLRASLVSDFLRYYNFYFYFLNAKRQRLWWPNFYFRFIKTLKHLLLFSRIKTKINKYISCPVCCVWIFSQLEPLVNITSRKLESGGPTDRPKIIFSDFSPKIQPTVKNGSKCIFKVNFIVYKR